MTPKTLHPRFHYGWIIAAVTFLTLLTSAGMRSTPGVLIIPLELETLLLSGVLILAALLVSLPPPL